MTKTALITGANRGIGFAIASGLAASGFKVLLGSRSLEAGEQAAKDINGDVQAVQVDLSDRDGLQKQINQILETQKSIDVLVNNAGILREGNFLEMGDSDFYDTIQTNFLAVFELTRIIVPGMIERGYGRVVNLSSGWGSFNEGLEGPASYSISKAALNALTLKLAESVPNTVKVNSMCPGWVRTDMGGADADRSPEQGAETAIWLASLPDDGPTGGFFRDKQVIDW